VNLREEYNRSWGKLHHMEIQCVMHNYVDIKYVRKGWEGIRGICKEVSNLNGRTSLAGADGRLRLGRTTRNRI
jgi:hypothetical protein